MISRPSEHKATESDNENPAQIGKGRPHHNGTRLSPLNHQAAIKELKTSVERKSE
jgi:hypothetical protein